MQTNNNCIVIFGASGDLTHRKLIPALYNLFKFGRLNQFSVLGVARTELNDDTFREKMREALLQTEDTTPETLEEFCSLPGVGRKIANLMMGEIYGDPSVVIADTHCIRLSNRLGLCSSENPVVVEKTLKKILPENTGFHYSHAMVAHGRKVCKSQNPDCENCFISGYCKFYKDREKKKCNTKK